jgi:hypothetical protein
MLGRLVPARYYLQRSVMRISTEVDKAFIIRYCYGPNFIPVNKALFQDAHDKYVEVCVSETFKKHIIVV